MDSEQKDLVDLARVSSMEMLKTVDEILTFTEFFQDLRRFARSQLICSRFLRPVCASWLKSAANVGLNL